MSAPVTAAPALGTPLSRVEGREKVTGAARYAYEPHDEQLAYAWVVGSEIAKGSVRALDEAAARALPGVVAVLWHANAPRLSEEADAELAVLQSPCVSYRGQVVALVVAESLEEAREAAAQVRIEYEAEPHDVELRADHPKLYEPETVNPSAPARVEQGDFEQAFATAPVQVDVTYVTPAFHNNAMEPHASTAVWEGDSLTLHDSTQGAAYARSAIAKALGIEPAKLRIVSHHVGGGFGSKGTPRPNAVLAALASKVTGRPVKLAVTRQQMFQITGYRTPTIQRMRLGATGDGRLTAIAHEVAEQTSTLKEFGEQSAVVTRMMYAAPNRLTAHRLAALDVPTPSWMRAPGECPGMYALESAMDELAHAGGIDPLELRIRNEPEEDPGKQIPFSSRNLVACLREGAERFGWAARDPAPGTRRQGRLLRGTGVAASTYPARRSPSQASARAHAGGGYTVSVAAADIGTGARTVLTQIAADALGADPAEVEMLIGDSALPRGPVAGGSMGTASWGSAVHGACSALRAALDEQGGEPGQDGLDRSYDTSDDVERDAELSRHAFGAQFAEVAVDADTGEVRLERMLGVFAAGRILNPQTARSQFIGGMTMGVGMALLEESVLDLEFGDYLNHDLAQYHVPVSADVPQIEAVWIDDDDDQLNPMGSKGIGEIGIVGAAAAVGNAVHHATGVRFRELPIRPDRVLEALER